MTGEQIGIVSATVVGIVQVIKSSGLAQRYAVLWAAGLAGITVGLFAYSAGDWGRATAFAYFVGWGVAFTSAAGVFGLATKAGPDVIGNLKDAGSAMKAAFTGSGTGNGGGKP